MLNTMFLFFRYSPQILTATTTGNNSWTSNETIQLFTNSAGGQYRDFDIYFQGKWAQHCWPKEWAENGMLSDITFLELFPVVVAILRETRQDS
jgi:hypothetical protein